MPIALIPASGESNTNFSFSGGFATVELNLEGNLANSSAALDISRNVTVTSSTFQVSYDSDDMSPGAVWIDINEDGIYEWEFNDTGYGDLGQQNVFFNGDSSSSNPVTNGNTSTPNFLFPVAGTLDSTLLNTSFSPKAGGGFFSVGEHQKVIETDIDGDGSPEPLFLSQIQSNNTTSIFWVDWDITQGTHVKPSINTCDNASSVSVGDINGDGDQDIVAFSSNSAHACIHIANGSSFDPVKNQTIPNGVLEGTLADLDGDGNDEVISISMSGMLTYQSWNNSINGLSTGVSQEINPNGSPGIPANLVSLYAGDFFGNSNASVLVKDALGHWSMWRLFPSGWGGPLISFDDIKNDEILTDLDNDGDIDIIGNGDMGSSLRINNGTTWNLVSLGIQLEMENSAVTDFDSDGNLELLIPQTGVSDGNVSTIEGSISIRSINASNISAPSELLLQPWSLPTSVHNFLDMDGDGVLEHIISAGESSFGVFIGGWHTIGLDANSDGNLEITSTGYAGDSSNGLDPLLVNDYGNLLKANLSTYISNQGSDIDLYGISMVNVSMTFTSSGSGEVNYSDLSLGYDCKFAVDGNPSVLFNLSNSLNQFMTGGVGNISIPIPVNSTKAGKLSLTDISVTTIQGAPNYSTPTTPILYVSEIDSYHVEISWNPLTDYGDDFISFEIFRLDSQSQPLNLNNPYNYSGTNNTTDSDVVTGSTYYYAVRSIHEYGITSNLSNYLEVTIPFPQTPTPISGIIVSDVYPDQGGSLEITWDQSEDQFSYYEVYLESAFFDNISGLQALLNISSSQNSTIINGLIDGQEYWAAVVAVTVFGNKTEEVSSVGPTYTRNDDPYSTNLYLSVTESISLGSPFSLEISVDVDGQQITPEGEILVEMETSNGTYPISNSWENISLSDFANLVSFANQISGDVTFWANYSGNEGDQQTRPTSAASASASSSVTVNAVLSSSEQIYELDWENETSVRVDLTAANSSQQSLLEGAEFSWVAYNDTSGNQTSGTGIFENGYQQVLISFNESGLLYVNITSPIWIDAGSNSLQLSLVTYGTTIEDNETETNQTIETPWSPDVMLDATLDCGEVIIDPSKDQELDCSITNPNNYSVDISLEADGWSQWYEYILFEPIPGQSDFTLIGLESKNLEIRVDILQNLRENALSSGLIQVDLRQGPANYTSPGDKSLTFEIQWTLIEESVVVEPIPQDNNTNQTSNTKDSSSSDNTMLILGGVGGVAVIGLAVFIVLRMRNSDFEDWDEDDLDMEPELEAPKRASKPLPVGIALDEFEDKTIADDTPDRPDIINNFDDSENYVVNSGGATDEYVEEEYHESDESGISTDEHGTEWYEDEVGVWWYREEGQEDWSEFVNE